MKTLIVTVALCLVTAAGFSQEPSWEWQNPKPQGSELNDVVMLSPTTYLMIGDGGLVVKTTDDGVSWTFKTLSIRANEYLSSIAFSPDNMHGVTTSNVGDIFYTSNQGETWMQTTKVVTASLKDVCYANERLVTAVGLNGTIVSSNDSGKTWGLATMEGSNHFHSISFADSIHGFISGRYGAMYRTGPDGKSWVKQDFPFGNILYSVDHLDAKHMIVGGEASDLFLSNDSGRTWSKQSMPIKTSNVWSVVRTTKERAFATDDYYGLLATTDEGATWDFKFNDYRKEFLKALSFSDPKHGVCVGAKGIILRTNDSGSTWFSLFERIPEASTLRGVFSFDQNTTVAVGTTILRSANAGKNWTLIANPANENVLRAVDFPDNVTGYAVGDSGIIVRSTDKGLTWARMQSPFSTDLLGVKFLDVQNGIVLGLNREIGITTDGGTSWFVQKVPFTDCQINGVSYLSPTSIVLTGARNALSGVTFHSSDRGKTWRENETSVSTFNPIGVSFADSLHGFMVGSPGIGSNDQPVAAFTTDGGNTWEKGEIDLAPEGRALFSVSAADRMRATAVGGLGNSVHTTDGGKTWTTVETYTRGHMWAVHHGSLQAATAVGFRATILRLTTSDQPLAVENPVASAAPKIIRSVYPNPAQTISTIDLAIESPDVLTLELLTVEGQLVVTIYNGLIGAGTYSLDANVASLASGTYILSARTSGHAEHHKIVVTR